MADVSCSRIWARVNKRCCQTTRSVWASFRKVRIPITAEFCYRLIYPPLRSHWTAVKYKAVCLTTPEAVWVKAAAVVTCHINSMSACRLQEKNRQIVFFFFRIEYKEDWIQVLSHWENSIICGSGLLRNRSLMPILTNDYSWASCQSFDTCCVISALFSMLKGKLIVSF